MKRETLAFPALLLFAILTLWVDERWAWSLFQIGIFSLAAWRFVRAYRFPRSAALIPLAFAAAWPIAQLAFGSTVSPAETSSAALNWFTFFLVCALALDIGSDPAENRRLLRILAVSGLILSAVAILQQVSSGGKIFWLFPSGYTDGVLGPFVSRNQYSAWVELLLPVALYLSASRDRYRALYLCAAAVLYGSVIAGASRAGFLLTTGEAAAALGLMVRRRRVPRKILLQFAGFAALAILAVGWQGLQARFEDRAAEAVRLDALQASIHMVRDQPWTGTGLGTWPQIYPRYAALDTGAFVNQAHNDWVQWAAEGGVPFFVLVLLFAALCSKPAVRSIYGLGVVAFLLHALVDYPMQQRPGLAAWFFAVAGLVLADGIARVRDR
jgi:O-antigen ligase